MSHLCNAPLLGFSFVPRIKGIGKQTLYIFKPPFHREVRHLQVVGIVVKNFSMMGCDQGATTPSCGAGRLA